MILLDLRGLLHPAVLRAEVQRGVLQHLQGHHPALHLSHGVHRADGERVLHRRHRRRALPGRHVPVPPEEVHGLKDVANKYFQT